MKKCLCILTVILLLVSCLTACGSLNKKPAVLGEAMSIPKDGIISSSVLEQIKSDNSVVTFAGVSNEIHYEWLLFGKDVTECKDINLAIEISEAGSEKVQFRFLSEEDFGFHPIVSIILDTIWNSSEAKLFSSNDLSESIADVSITGNKANILKFTPPTQTGTFVILPEKESETGTQTQSTDTDCSTAQSQENPQDSTKFTPDDKSELSTSGSSTSEDNSSHILSDGSSTEQDKYKTDPVPEGKPMPVEPEDQNVNEKKSCTCTFSIECSTILNNLKDLNPDKLDEVPSNGVIFPKTTVTFYEGESVYDVLRRICKENNIHMEASWTPIYNSAYVEGIHNLYEFDCGSGSGWMYRVDGWYPNYGCSRYQLKQGENVEWRYTCDLGNDVGGGYAIGG